MCDWCEDWAAREPREPGMAPDLAARARVLEREMPGAPLPESSWRIALGQESGAIAWADQLRILAALKAAEAAPSRTPFARRRRGGEFRCAFAV